MYETFPNVIFAESETIFTGFPVLPKSSTEKSLEAAEVPEYFKIEESIFKVPEPES